MLYGKRDLLSNGLGTKVKQADPILPEDESVLWEKGVFGVKTWRACSAGCSSWYVNYLD